ncbi:MAG: hypothetical protein IBX68_07360 [Dehalococcoidia bacterium]|nr:hypothetical protein [Dehalococcoidia bacterium]
MVHSIQAIKIENIKLNLENPRYDPTSSQQEALGTIIRKQGRKLLKLAEDIAEKGLNPSKLLMVTTTDEPGTFKVIEGNRRLAALKILSSGQLLMDLELPPSLVRQYKRLQGQLDGSPPATINCSVVPEEEAIHWMRLEHTGENEGVGVISWNTRARHRFRDSSPALQAIEIIEKSRFLDAESRAGLENIAVTNVERVLGTPEARKLIGVELKHKKLVLNSEDAKGRLALLIGDVAKKDIRVKDVMTLQERVNYARRLASRPLPEAVIPVPTKAGSKESKPMGRIKASRETLIPKGLELTIPLARINSIYMELQLLKVEQFTNSCAVLFRVFLEMSADDFAKRNGISFKGAGGNDIKLRKKLEAVANFMEQNGLSTRPQLHGVKTSISRRNHVFSVDSWHAYVHNQYYTPSASDLKNNWDSIQSFFEQMWKA